MYHEYPQFSWLIRCEFHFEGGFEMNSSPVFFLRAAYAHFLLHSSSSDFCFLLSGTTPIHAPRPRPITYSIGIGTSDFGDGSVDVSTQGGPPQLNLSSFLNELSLTGVSSPVRQAPVSVLSPVLRRSFTVASPPPARITLDAAVNAVVDCRDMAINACVGVADQTVQAVTETGDAATCYDPPAITPPSSPPPPIADVPGAVDVDVAPSEVPSAGTTETLLEIPDDFSFRSTPSGVSAPGSVASNVATADIEKSPMGPSLLDSDDEPIASRLPG